MGNHRATPAPETENQTASLDKATKLGRQLLSTQKWLQLERLAKDLPPYSTVFWHDKQWRAEGVLEQIRAILHPQVREQVKKNQNGQRCS